MSLSSKLIQGTKPEPDTITELYSTMGIPEGRPIALMVLEVTFKTKKIYCCLSGGSIAEDEPRLTLVGRAALEALLNLPLGNNDALFFQEVAIGRTPLREKVREAVMRAPEGAKLCFVGDMQGELDGKMLPALNWSGGVVDIAH